MTNKTLMKEGECMLQTWIYGFFENQENKQTQICLMSPKALGISGWPGALALANEKKPLMVGHLNASAEAVIRSALPFMASVTNHVAMNTQPLVWKTGKINLFLDGNQLLITCASEMSVSVGESEMGFC